MSKILSATPSRSSCPRAGSILHLQVDAHLSCLLTTEFSCTAYTALNPDVVPTSQVGLASGIMGMIALFGVRCICDPPHHFITCSVYSPA
jgi:hypothetical protein